MATTERLDWPEHNHNIPIEEHTWSYKDGNGRDRCSGCGISRRVKDGVCFICGESMEHDNNTIIQLCLKCVMLESADRI